MNLDEPPVFAGNVVPTQNLNRHSEERNARMDKKRMTRASVMLFCLLCFQFVLTQAAVAQQKPLTSEKLSIDDVKCYAATGFWSAPRRKPSDSLLPGRRSFDIRSPRVWGSRIQKPSCWGSRSREERASKRTVEAGEV
jgi:hypothetical protein